MWIIHCKIFPDGMMISFTIFSIAADTISKNLYKWYQSQKVEIIYEKCYFLLLIMTLPHMSLSSSMFMYSKIIISHFQPQYQWFVSNLQNDWKINICGKQLTWNFVFWIKIDGINTNYGFSMKCVISNNSRLLRFVVGGVVFFSLFLHAFDKSVQTETWKQTGNKKDINKQIDE